MKDIYTSDQLKQMRNRLYDRGSLTEETVRHDLEQTVVDVNRNWNLPQAEPNPAPQVAPTSSRHRYRTFILLGSLLVLVLVAAISSVYLFFGGNQISGRNIVVSIKGPLLVGGGEEVSFEAVVSNENQVAIESATLILHYPNGTRSVGDSPRNLFEERIALNAIPPDGAQTVPVKVVVFGEENAEKSITATVEYRVVGSNGTFYKDAEPFVFRVSSSPLVLRVEGVEKVAAGQQIDITVTAEANSSQSLSNVILTASYPTGFKYTGSDPAPAYGQNVLQLGEVLSSEPKKIVIHGVTTGLVDESFRINFEAGPANPDNQFALGSALATSYSDFKIERPFLDVAVTVDQESVSPIVIEQGEKSDVSIVVKNTLSETIYDLAIEVVPTGNAIDPNSIKSAGGYYDSNTGSVRWEVSNKSSFDKVAPGDTRDLGFTISPNSRSGSAAFGLTVNVYARRVAESSAQETLLGSVELSGKYADQVVVGAQAGRNSGGFTDTGTVPPRVGQNVTYSITLVAEAGGNDLSEAVVEAGLPVYVNWLNAYKGDGSLEYNSVAKTLTWKVGDIGANKRKTLTMQVGFTPSISQLNTAPVLLKEQTLRAVDRFTGTGRAATGLSVTTELSPEMGYGLGSGLVTN